MVTPYKKPEHTADTSNAGHPLRIPIFLCAMHADEGILRSGVEVARIMRSISFGSSPAAAMAFSPARAARSDVHSSGSATRRWRMPKFCTIHSGDVGRSPTISSLVRIFSGTYEPVALIETLSNRLFRIAIGPPFRVMEGCSY